MTRLNRRYSALLIVLASVSLLACGEGEQDGRVALTWTIGSGVACNATNVDIENVRLTLTDISDEDQIIVTTSYCAAKSATLDNIRPGTYDLLLEGAKGTDFEISTFRAEVTGIVVLPEQTTTLDEIAMEFLPPLPDPGTLQLSWGFETGLCGANSIEKVRVVIWQTSIVKSYEKTLECDIDAPGYISISLSPNKYDVRLFGINDQQQITMRAGSDDFAITEGGTTSLKGSEGLTLKATQLQQ
jgi:hypothetical protein